MFKPILQLLTPPVFDDVQTTRRAAHLLLFCKILLFGTIVITTPRIFATPNNFQPVFIALLTIFLVTVGIIALTRAKRIVLASAIFTLFLFSGLMFSAFFTGGVRAVGYFGGVTISILMAGLLLEWRGVWTVAGMGILVGIGFVFAETSGHSVQNTFVTPLSIFATQTLIFALTIGLLHLLIQDLRMGESRVRDELAARQRMEAALRLSEKRYRTLAANLPNSAVILFDHELRFVLVDGPEIEKTGYSKNAMIGKLLHEALPPNFVALAEPNMRAALEGKHFTAELPFNDQIHNYQYLPLEDEDGDILYGMVLVQNVTAQKRADEALRQSELKFRTVFDIAPYTIVIQGAEDGRYVDVNRAAYEGFGISHEDYIGRTPDKMGLPEFNSVYAREMRAKMRANGGRLINEEFSTSFQDQQIFILYSAQELELSGQRLILTASVDISKLKRVEAELRVLNEELE